MISEPNRLQIKQGLYDYYALTYQKRTQQFAKVLELDYEYFLGSLSGKSILDLGCGPGRDSKIFQERGYKPECYDLSEKMLSICQKLGLPIIQGDMERIDLGQRKYCGIWSYTSLTTIPKNHVWKIIARLSKYLETNGVLYLGLIEGIYEGWKPADTKYHLPRYVSRFTAIEIYQHLQRNYELIYFHRLPINDNGRNSFLNFLFRRRGSE